MNLAKYVHGNIRLFWIPQCLPIPQKFTYRQTEDTHAHVHTPYALQRPLQPTFFNTFIIRWFSIWNVHIILTLSQVPRISSSWRSATLTGPRRSFISKSVAQTFWLDHLIVGKCKINIKCIRLLRIRIKNALIFQSTIDKNRIRSTPSLVVEFNPERAALGWADGCRPLHY